MNDTQIFIVRFSAAREPTHEFHATVRAVESAETAVVGTASELAKSMLSALGVTGRGVAGDAAAPASPVRPSTPQPDARATLRRLAVASAVLILAATLWLPAAAPVPNGTAIAFVLLAATGLVSGFLSGLLGIGGALVVVPALYLLLPLLGVAADRVPHVAVGSSLLVMIPTALAATWAQHRRRGIDGRWLARLAPAMLGGAALGAVLAMQLRGPALSMLFALQSFYYGWGLMRTVPPAADGARVRILAVCARAPGWLAGPLIAAFCACAGMGAGSLSVPYMMTRGVTLLKASATSCALNLCLALGGAAALTVLSASAPSAALSFSWEAAAAIGASAVLSAKYGVALAHRLPVDLFRRLLGTVTLLGAVVLTARTVWICF